MIGSRRVISGGRHDFECYALMTHPLSFFPPSHAHTWEIDSQQEAPRRILDLVAEKNKYIDK